MATLDELKLSWANDCVIKDDLGNAAISTPMLHAKYLDELITAKLKHTKITHEIAELKAVKGKYFRGEMTKEELTDRGWTQWQYRTLKSDIPELIDADAEYQKFMARESYMKTTIYFLESVLSEIKNRNWSIRAAIDWTKFRAGA
jgi:hypothetical protein